MPCITRGFYHRKRQQMDILSTKGILTRDIDGQGYVASGRLDGFFHNNINLWDIAAGEILVKEAGGIVNDIHKFDLNKIDIKASSAAINDKMLENLINF